MDSRSESKDKLFLPTAVRRSQVEFTQQSQKNKRTEDSFESKSPPFHLTFSSALIGRQSAPRAFRSRLPRGTRACCKIRCPASGRRTNNPTYPRAPISLHDKIAYPKASCGLDLIKRKGGHQRIPFDPKLFCTADTARF